MTGGNKNFVVDADVFWGEYSLNASREDDCFRMAVLARCLVSASLVIVNL